MLVLLFHITSTGNITKSDCLLTGILNGLLARAPALKWCKHNVSVKAQKVFCAFGTEAAEGTYFCKGSI